MLLERRKHPDLESRGRQVTGMGERTPPTRWAGGGGVGFWEDLGPHLGQSQSGEVTVMGPGLSFLPLEAKGQATQVRDNEAQVSLSKENACMGGSSA